MNNYHVQVLNWSNNDVIRIVTCGSKTDADIMWIKLRGEYDPRFFRIRLVGLN